MGKTRYTTHGDSGGTGIGLMTTFELIKVYSASFIINENFNYSPYCKKVSVCFDGLYQIKIHSNRDEIFNVASYRDDIIFI